MSAGSVSRFRGTGSAAAPPARARLEGRSPGRHRGRPARGPGRPGRHRRVQDDAPQDIIHGEGEGAPC